jgi:hypothetical protein
VRGEYEFVVGQAFIMFVPRLYYHDPHSCLRDAVYVHWVTPDAYHSLVKTGACLGSCMVHHFAIFLSLVHHSLPWYAFGGWFHDKYLLSVCGWGLFNLVVSGVVSLWSCFPESYLCVALPH